MSTGHIPFKNERLEEIDKFLELTNGNLALPPINKRLKMDWLYSKNPYDSSDSSLRSILSKSQQLEDQCAEIGIEISDQGFFPPQPHQLDESGRYLQVFPIKNGWRFLDYDSNASKHWITQDIDESTQCIAYDSDRVIKAITGYLDLSAFLNSI